MGRKFGVSSFDMLETNFASHHFLGISQITWLVRRFLHELYKTLSSKVSK